MSEKAHGKQTTPEPSQVQTCVSIHLAIMNIIILAPHSDHIRVEKQIQYIFNRQ